MISREKPGVEIRELISQNDVEILKVYNEKWTSNKILHPRVQKPGLALAGYFKYLDRDRIQLFGNTEMGYLNHLERSEFEKRLTNFMAYRVPGVIVSNNPELDDFIITRANKYKVPILVSKLTTSLLMSRISSFLYRFFSKRIRLNGVLMDIMGQGILITGQSGIGKSETALELVNKGHQLICDDLVEFYLNSNEEPMGRSIDPIKNWLEVRGLGIINIVDLYGFGAILEEKKLDLVINLEKWNPKKQYDRLGEEDLYFKLLGTDIPMFNIPVSAGRNVSTLVEVAVKYFISRKKGISSFVERHYAPDRDLERNLDKYEPETVPDPFSPPEGNPGDS